MIKGLYEKVKFKLSKPIFFRNVFTLAKGSAVSQLVLILAAPLLTRIYSPQDIGIYALFIAVTSVIGSIADGRYQAAIMLPYKDKSAINIFAIGLLVACFVSLIIFVIIIFFNENLGDFFNIQDFQKIIFIFPISILLISFWNLLKYYNIRQKQYSEITKSTVVKSITLVISQVFLGFLKMGAIGLVISQVISYLFGNIQLLKNLIKDKNLFLKITKLRTIALAKKYKDFPLYNVPATLSDNIALKLPSIFLPKIFGLAVGGYFFLAYKIIAIPSQLIGRSISEVFFQEMIDRKNNNLQCLPFFIKIAKYLALIGLVISTIIYALSPYLFKILFGNEWQMSGEIAKYLCVSFLLTFVVSALSPIFAISGYIKRGALWRHLYLFTSIIIFLITIFLKLDFFNFLLLFIFHELILYLIYFYLMYKSVIQLDDKII